MFFTLILECFHINKSTNEHTVANGLIKAVLKCFNMPNLTSLTWGVTATVGTGGADAVLQPGAVGEGVPLVWRPGRRQTLLDRHSNT